MMIVTVKRTDIPYLSARQEVRIEQIYKVAFAVFHYKQQRYCFLSWVSRRFTAGSQRLQLSFC